MNQLSHCRDKDISSKAKMRDTTSVNLSMKSYLELRHPRYGNANPEIVQNPLWHEILRKHWGPKDVRRQFEENPESSGGFDAEETARRLQFPQSSDREGAGFQIWAYNRIRSTRTEISDRQAIRIGGFYKEFGQQDATDFCIYNEVVVENWGGGHEIYAYPKHVFPPIYDHTATKLGDSILIVGGRGYVDLTQTEEILLYRLDLNSFQIDTVKTKGTIPGHLFRHGAISDGASKLIICGGLRLSDGTGETEANETMYELDTSDWTWRTLASNEGGFLGISVEDYKATRRPKFGSSNPEKVKIPLWDYIIRNDLSGYMVRTIFGDWDYAAGRPYPGQSDYRQLPVGPVWSWSRFGQSISILKDGRKFYIGGEYEDAYDPDFCIYNDVVIVHPDGQFEVLIYPENIFPPTDFHSATLVGNKIILIGSTGYMDQRHADKTQVLKLNTETLVIEAVSTSGENPGWISRHEAEYIGDNTILILGGSILQPDEQGFIPNTKMFELNLDNRTWHPVTAGDTRFFSVTMEEYQAGKLARYGTANPEFVDNSFWLEMARRQWPPSRARQQFDDPALPSGDMPHPATGQSSAVPGPAIWSSVREQSAALFLQDGRHLLIGGEIKHYSDERQDAWIYNDIVLTRPDKSMAVYAYPLNDFPLMSGLSAAEVDNKILIFGRGRHDGQFAHCPIALSLDPEEFKIELLDRMAARKPAVITEEPLLKNKELLFKVQKKTHKDQDRFVSFCLKTLSWLED